jgi:ribonuclease J
MVTDRQAFVHVSGHPGRPELAEMYRWIRPQILLPVHGEVRHMHEQARFGIQQGIPGAVRQTNGDLIRLAPGKPTKLDEVHAGRLVLDGDVILPADGATINERRRVALYGLISVAVAIRNGKLIGEPQIRLQGVPVEEDRDAFLTEAVAAAKQVVRDDKRGGDALREALRLGVRRVATRWTGKKPVVDVLVIEA